MSKVIIKSIREPLAQRDDLAIRAILEALAFKIYDKDKVDEIIEHARYILRERCGLIMDCDVTWNAPTVNANLYFQNDQMFDHSAC